MRHRTIVSHKQHPVDLMVDRVNVEPEIVQIVRNKGISSINNTGDVELTIDDLL